MQQRVAARLSADGARYAGLDRVGKRLRIQALVNEELESWVNHRAQLGLPTLSDTDEDTLVAAVHAALGGLGPLEPLLARTDIEDIFFTGTAPTMLRLADGRKVAGPRLAHTDVQLAQLLQSMAASPLDDAAGREFSISRPLLQLRMKSVGLLGARMSAAMDVTPHPAGTIRVHRHMETSLEQLSGLGMIDAALSAFLTAIVLAGGKVMVSGAAGVGKTVLLRALCRAIPLDRMIVTVEDDRELGLHVVPARDARRAGGARAGRLGGAAAPGGAGAQLRGPPGELGGPRAGQHGRVVEAVAAGLPGCADRGGDPRRGRGASAGCGQQRHRRGDVHHPLGVRTGGVRPAGADGADGRPAAAGGLRAAGGDSRWM